MQHIKYFFACFFIAMVSVLAFSQNTWVQKPDFGGGKRAGAIAFSCNGKGYVGLGHDTSYLYQDLWEFDTLGNTWTQKADFPPGGRAYAIAFSIGSRGYVGMGGLTGSQQYDFWEYNPTTDVWTRKADADTVGR